MSDGVATLLSVLSVGAVVALMILPVWITRRKQGRRVFEPVHRDIERYKTEHKPELERASARLDGVPTCPRCGSTSISAVKRGYRFGRGLFWGLAFGFVGFWLFAVPGAAIGLAAGLATGNIGSQAIIATCISCGCQYSPSARRIVDKVMTGR